MARTSLTRRRRRLRKRRWVAALLVFVLFAAGVWLALPLSPAALYARRCGACHEPPEAARIPPGQAGAVVEAMRRLNGADAVIDEKEAETIVRYLREKGRKDSR